MELAGRHVVVTGAASGIGRALALRFADEGARAVVVSDLDEAGAQAVAEQVGGLAVRTDVGREEDIRALIARAEAANGPIDLFFSNAGITGPSGGPEMLDDATGTCCGASTRCRTCGRRARCCPGCSSAARATWSAPRRPPALLAQLGALGYTVTKHAAVAVAEWLSMTYGDRGIRVSCLCPQYVRTPMVTDGELPLDKLESVATILEPEQVADGGGRRDPRGALPDPPASRGRRPTWPTAVTTTSAGSEGCAACRGISRCSTARRGYWRLHSGTAPAGRGKPATSVGEVSQMEPCDHVGLHSGQGRYDRAQERIRYVLVCDACDSELRELDSSITARSSSPR